MNAYRIKDWNLHFENNRTRELKRMDWLPIPNKHDGDGYTTLVGRKNGAAMLGGWLALLQVASKCGTRGTLLRDAATPHTSGSLSRITRIPSEIFDELIPILVTECKWLEVIVLSDPAPSCDIPAPSCGQVTMEWKGMEGNGIHTHQPSVEERFEAFWTAYPRKVGKQEALKMFKRIKDVKIEQILSSIEAQKKTEMWQKDGGQFIPHPSTWLHRGSWDDHPEIQINGHAKPKPNPDIFPYHNGRYTATNAPKRQDFQTDGAFESCNSLYESWLQKRGVLV